MVIIGGDADGNEGDVFFFHFFSFVFELFFNLCMYANVFFFMFSFGCLISRFAGTRSVLLIASHDLRGVLSRERMLR
jgi:hypothetical protein